MTEILQEILEDNYKGMKEFFEDNGFNCDKCKDDLRELEISAEESIPWEMCDVCGQYMIEGFDNHKCATHDLQCTILNLRKTIDQLEEDLNQEKNFSSQLEERIRELEDNT
jgi:hypothetical protein